MFTNLNTNKKLQIIIKAEKDTYFTLCKVEAMIISLNESRFDKVLKVLD